MIHSTAWAWAWAWACVPLISLPQSLKGLLPNALQIYDVTTYLDDHPGGADALLQATGEDATEEFDDAGHSKSAKELMQDYFIGELGSTRLLGCLRWKEDAGFVSKLVDTAAQYWAIPAAAIGISVVVVAILCAPRK